MKLERILVIGAATAVLLTVAPWLYMFSSSPMSGNPGDWSSFGSFVGGILSPVLAFASFVGLLMTLNQQRVATATQQTEADDRNYFNHAVSSLERAYKVISGGDQRTGPPARDRLAWLTCARLLLSADEVSTSISPQSKGLKALFEGEKEHWRYCFYEIFQRVDPPVGRDSAFFARPDDPCRGEIEERSIRIVFDFVNWPEGKEDPIARVSHYSLEELNAMRLTMFGVRDYLLPGAERRAR